MRGRATTKVGMLMSASRLATSEATTIGRLSRRIRTEVGSVDQAGANLPRHLCFDRAINIFGEIAAGHAGLIREQEDVIARVVEATDRGRGIRHPANAILRAYIAVVVIDDAVAVQERCRLFDSRHDVVRDADVAMIWVAMLTTSVAGMSRMQA